MKSRLHDGTSFNAELVAKGEIELAIQQTSEILPGNRRRFAMLGAHGQSILIDPEIKLVIVRTGANATEEAGETSLGREREAFWRGVLRFYDKK